MAIVHIVLMKKTQVTHDSQFKPNTDPNTVHKVCSDMLDLQNNCVSPSTGKPYILNASGGRNSNPEGLDDGMTHGFVSVFASEDDRTYYCEHDPAHLKFKKDALEVLEKAVVVDYEPAAF